MSLHDLLVYFFLALCCVCVFSRSVGSDSLWPQGLEPTRLLCPWGFSRQEYWNGLPCPPSGDLPNPGIDTRSPKLHAHSLPSELPGRPKNTRVGSLSLLQGISPTQEWYLCLLHWQVDSLPTGATWEAKHSFFVPVMMIVTYSEGEKIEISRSILYQNVL